jgi:uncharacterized protein YecE (DUF72 family)
VAKDVYVGVSGFSYPSWRGRFYPKDMKSEKFLSFYYKHLQSVEINSSFYAPPRATVVKSWSDGTGEKFRFSFKAPQMITHVLKLGKNSAEAADRFSKGLDTLGQRCGPILFQLPPYSKLDLDLLGRFLSETSDITKRVFEFRHESWFQDSTYQLLEKHRTGFCIAETEESRTALQTTGGIAYFRLRKESYDAKTIDQWAETIRETARDLPECYVYLRHDETGENALLAQRLSKELLRPSGSE